MSIFERSPQEHITSPESLTVPTHQSIIIDPENCEDSDDSFCITTTNTSLNLIVLITHPASFLDKANPLLLQALANKHSYYDPYKGMLPHKFTRAFSLSNRNSPTPVLALSLDSDHTNPHDLRFSINQAYSKPLAFLTYTQADAILKSSYTNASVYQQLSLAHEFFHRTKSLTSNRPQKLKRPVDQHKISDIISFTQVIAQLMTLANLGLSQYAQDHGIPILHRNCQEIKAGAICQHICPHQSCHRSYDSVNPLGFYCTVPAGHAPLGSDSYTHGTSPLRRAVDFINQMQFHAHLTQQPYPFSYSELQLIASQIN